MIGIILLLVVFFWLLMGKNRKVLEKLFLSASAVAAYILYLYYKGMTTEEIIAVLFWL